MGSMGLVVGARALNRWIRRDLLQSRGDRGRNLGQRLLSYAGLSAMLRLAECFRHNKPVTLQQHRAEKNPLGSPTISTRSTQVVQANDTLLPNGDYSGTARLNKGGDLQAAPLQGVRNSTNHFPT